MSPTRQRKRINPRPPQSPRSPSPVLASSNSSSSSSSNSGSAATTRSNAENSISISSSGGPPPAVPAPQPPGQRNQQRVRDSEELEQRLRDLREELRRDAQSHALSQNTAAKLVTHFMALASFPYYESPTTEQMPRRHTT